MKLNSLFTKLFFLIFVINYGLLMGQAPYVLKTVGDEAYNAILQFYQYDRGIPLQVEIVEKNEGDKYIREKIIFHGINNSRVVGYLATPKKGNVPFPCVLQIHGLGVSKNDFWGKMYHHGELVTDSLLSLGIAVLALDLPYHGDRLHEGNFISPGEMFFKKAWGYRMRDMTIQSTVEYRRAIDYLETRDDIDHSKLGVIGYSFGSVISSILTGIDDRIDASVVCSPAIIKPRSFLPPEESLSGFAPQTFIRSFKNRPILILAAKNDDFNCTVTEAEQLYNLIDGLNKELIFYNSGHKLPTEHANKAIEWLMKNLK